MKNEEILSSVILSFFLLFRSCLSFLSRISSMRDE